MSRLLLLALFVVIFTVGPGRAEAEWSDTNPPLNITHIFIGEINKRGKPVGLHVAPIETKNTSARIKEVLSGPNKAGVYTALIEIFDPHTKRWKEKFSSFFPDRLSRQQVIDAILFAIRNNRLKPGAKWRGPSGHGFFIEGYHFKDGAVNTAYPLYVAD